MQINIDLETIYGGSDFETLGQLITDTVLDEVRREAIKVIRADKRLKKIAADAVNKAFDAALRKP